MAREAARASRCLDDHRCVWGRAPELAGPGEEQMVDMVRRLKRLRGASRLVLPLTLPGQAGRAMAGGALLPTGSGPRGRQSFTDWLRGTGAAASSAGATA